MKMKTHWCDLLIRVCAIWLLASPVVLGSSPDLLPDAKAAAFNAYTLGTALLICSVLPAWRQEDNGNDMVNITFGCWLALSPFSLGFSAFSGATANAIVLGFVVIALAMLDIYLLTGMRWHRVNRLLAAPTGISN